METDKQILKELKDLKDLFSKLMGTSDLPVKERFSKEAIAKVAKEFQKLAIERGEWVTDYDIGKYIRNAPYRAGAFIINEFAFKNYFKKGAHHYFFYKKDLIALGTELKKRDVNLNRYSELKADQTKFKTYVATVFQKGKPKGKAYKLPEYLNCITTSPVPMPEVEIVREDLTNLKDEFFKNKLAAYIDIYDGNHAMAKYYYRYDRYMKPELKRQIKRWVDNFNIANSVLEEITKKKEIFIPVPDEEQIRL
jgi:hypothetical protein